MIAPIKAQPANVFLDRLDVFHFLFGRIGIVKTQMTTPAIFNGSAKIQANRLGMANMQIAVGLRWKAGNHSGVFATGQIAVDNFVNKWVWVSASADTCSVIVSRLDLFSLLKVR